MPGPGGHHGGGPGGHHGGGPGGPGGFRGGHHGGPAPRPPMGGGWGMGPRPPRRRGCCGCLFPVLGVIAVLIAAVCMLLF